MTIRVSCTRTLHLNKFIRHHNTFLTINFSDFSELLIFMYSSTHKRDIKVFCLKNFEYRLFIAKYNYVISVFS
jgi:hypothetical protein